jgi:hypothetical protein
MESASSSMRFGIVAPVREAAVKDFAARLHSTFMPQWL